MVFRTNRRGSRPETPRLRPRVAPIELAKVDFTELVPEPVPFLGQAAYIQLEFFEGLAKAVATAPTLPAKEGLSAAAGVALRKHHALIAEIRRLPEERDGLGHQLGEVDLRQLGRRDAGAQTRRLGAGTPPIRPEHHADSLYPRLSGSLR